MQGTKGHAGISRVDRRNRLAFRCSLFPLVVGVLGSCILFLLLPTFHPAGLDLRRLPEEPWVETNSAALKRDFGQDVLGQTALRLFLLWRTVAGARSSFASLKAALQGSSLLAPLCIVLEGPQPADGLINLERFARQLDWPFGAVQVEVQDSPSSGALPFDWRASKDNELAMFFNEGVHLEKHDVWWLERAVQTYGNADTPGEALVAIHVVPALAQSALPKGATLPPSPFLLQTPCTDGCLFFPGLWRHFQAYHQQRQALNVFELPPTPGMSSGGQRWQRHLAEMMIARGWLALHPPLQADARPLQNSGRPPDLPAFTTLPILDAALRPIPTPDRLLYTSIAWAMRPLLQTGDPASQALAHALYGAPSTRQCILEEWTQSGVDRHQGREGWRGMRHVQGGQDAQRNWVNGDVGERFLFFSAQFGLSNQLLAYADMAALATVLNRTLVLAPLRQKDGTFLDVESVLDMDKLFRIRGHDQSPTGDERVPAIRHRDFMDSIMRDRPLRSLIRFDWSNRFGGREKDDSWFHVNGLLRPTTQQVELPTVALYRHAALLLLGGCSTHQVVAFDIGFLATSWRQEAYLGDGSGGAARYDAVRRQLHGWVHRPFRVDLVRQVFAAVRPLVPFTCLHLRRGDFADYCAMIHDQRRSDPTGPYGIPFFSTFTYRNCYPNIAHLALLLNATSLVPPGQRLYIATNEPDRDLLALHFGDAFDWLDLEALQEETAALPGWLPPVLLDRLVCQHAAVLVGNRWSTFSRSIAQSGPGHSHFVGFGQLALLSRSDDNYELQLLRDRNLFRLFDTRQAEGLYMLGQERGEGPRGVERLGFRLPVLPRTCMQQPSEGAQGERYFYRIGYLRSRLPRHSHDVTLVTYAAAGQLGLLRRLLRSWPGVLSVGYCVSPSNPSGQLAAMRLLFRESEAAGRGRLDVSLLARDPLSDGVAWEQTVAPAHAHLGWSQARSFGCPLSLLLELALDAALSELVGMVDPWAIPCRHLYATWAQLGAYRRVWDAAQREGGATRGRWLAVGVKDGEHAARHTADGGSPPFFREIPGDWQEQFYVLASRQQLPCLRHLAVADDDSATVVARHLTQSGANTLLLNSGYFTCTD